MKRRLGFILKITFVILVLVVLVANLMPNQTPIDHEIKNIGPIDRPQFQRAISHLLGPPISMGNKVQAFYNGVEIFPAMLKAIDSAQKTITFEAYIYWSDRVGQRFIQALADKAKAGVKVHVLVDWLGSQKLKQEDLDYLKQSGVEVEIYRPLQFDNLLDMNNRTHRRILVVDGKIGFTGGVGISDEWDGDADSPEKWRDTQFMVEGPAVNSLQNAFMDNWLKLKSKVLHDESYFPEIFPQGPALAQVFKSSSEGGSESIRLMYQMAIASAKKSIYLSSAYFLPDNLFVRELILARERGVQVQIVVPGPFLDTHVVRIASKEKWGELLQAGIEIYEYQPARFHNKVMIIDEIFVSVGSTNFDNRSFLLNEEANLNVWDPEFARSQVQAFEKDRRQSQIVTYEAWLKRPKYDQFKEKIYNIIGLQL